MVDGLKRISPFSSHYNGNGVARLISHNVAFLLGLRSRYPFLLPNLVGSIGALLMLPLVILYVPETKDFDRPPAGGKFNRCTSSKLQSMLDAVSLTDEVHCIVLTPTVPGHSFPM